jgi:hypothetical protein
MDVYRGFKIKYRAGLYSIHACGVLIRTEDSYDNARLWIDQEIAKAAGWNKIKARQYEYGKEKFDEN